MDTNITNPEFERALDRVRQDGHIVFAEAEREEAEATRQKLAAGMALGMSWEEANRVVREM